MPIAADYEEAALVRADSPKASAALSRRCLQAVLTAQGFTQHDLKDQIKAAVDKLPSSELAGSLDHVRIIGNFAAHPKKSTNTGEILDVALGEAEWNLDVLDMLFDYYYYYYVLPAKMVARRVSPPPRRRNTRLAARRTPAQARHRRARRHCSRRACAPATAVRA